MPSYTLEINVVARDRASRSLQGVSNSLKEIAKFALGYAFGRGLFNIARGILDIGKSAIKAAADLQTFNVAVETLTAQNAVAAGAFDTVSDALKNIVPNSQKVIRDLRELSLISPFDFRQIANAWRLSAAYGAGSAMAVKLTEAIVDTGAALGLSTEMMQRLNYNLSQALVVGDLTALNLRQLKLVGLDLARVFDQQLGKSIEQIRADLKSGATTLKEVSEAYMEYVEKNFGGAAERLAKTFSGVLANVKDLFFFTATDLLTPTIERWSETLNKFFDVGKDVLDSGVLREIGFLLGELTDKAMDMVEGLASAAKTFAGDFLNIIGGAAQEAKTLLGALPAELESMLDPLAATGFEAARNFADSFNNELAAAAANAWFWGMNIVAELAGGIVEGAATVLVAAMNFIGQILSWFLGPGSPPRIAPDLPAWGANAFTEFLKGFANAEWGVLESVQSTLEDVMNTMVDIGLMAAADLGPAMAAITKQLVEGIDEYLHTGVMAQSVFDALINISSDFGQHLADLLSKQLALNKATADYELAVKAFDTATESEKDAQEAVDKLNKEYQELVATRAPKRLVREKKAELDAAKATLDSAKKQKTEAEKALDIAKEHLDVLKDQASWQEKILAQLMKIAQWMSRAQEEAAGGGAAGGGAGKKGGAGAGLFAGFGVPDFEQIAAGLDASLSAGGILERLANAFQPIIDKWNEAGGIKDQLKSIGEAFDNLKGIISEFISESGVGDIVESLGKIIPSDLVENIGKVIGAIVALKIAFWLGGIVIGVVGGIIGALMTPIGLVIAGLATLLTAWTNDWGGIKTKTTEWVTNEVLPALEDISNWLGLTGPEKLATFETWWSNTKPKVWDAFSTVAGEIHGKLMDVADILAEGLWLALDKIRQWFDEHGGIFGALRDVLTAAAGAAAALVGALRELQTIRSTTPVNIVPPEVYEREKSKTTTGGPEEEGQQKGGLWRRGGPAWLHGTKSSPEAVIPLNTFTGIKALSKAFKEAGGGGTGTTIIIENLSLPSVTNGRSLITELQSYTIQGRP